MRERPIIFSGEMVKVILAGTKTQTRRVVKGQSLLDISIDRCPYGFLGDRLWVRETFALECPAHNEPTDGPFQNDIDWGLIVPHYRATEPDIELVTDEQEDDKTRWSPSIFMPRWASRILLEITEVRVERVQKITPLNCLKEGINLDTDMFPTINAEDKYRRRFQSLWDSLNAKRGHGWESNPWVWVITFKVTQ